ncbi:MAG: NADPH-dependent FMN reductase [Thermoplasmata archaeon]
MSEDQRLRIGIIMGSTRPGRVNEAVARWTLEHARARTEVDFELVDLLDFHLPLLDEPIPPSAGRYSKPHSLAWAAKVASFDGYIFVTPEYTHGPPAALKNAIDFIYAEWNNKAAGFVSYGSVGGVRAVEQLRLNLAEQQVATVRSQVWFLLSTDFEDYTKFRPNPAKARMMESMLDQLIAWSGALRSLRSK